VHLAQGEGRAESTLAAALNCGSKLLSQRANENFLPTNGENEKARSFGEVAARKKSLNALMVAHYYIVGVGTEQLFALGVRVCS
jgi:hypothetical protein